MAERRLYPRYDCAFPVFIRDSQGQTFVVNANNISINGIAVEIDQTLKNQLMQQGLHLLAGDTVSLSLPIAASVNSDDPESLIFNCRIQYLRRLSQNSYQLGGFFDDLDEPRQALLEALVNQNKVL